MYLACEAGPGEKYLKTATDWGQYACGICLLRPLTVNPGAGTLELTDMQKACRAGPGEKPLKTATDRRQYDVRYACCWERIVNVEQLHGFVCIEPGMNT